MRHYVTHHFAHAETLERAERWLLQMGFQPGQIEAHREGVPWITVLAGPDQVDEARLVFQAAEHGDPDGWPSFWELARMPHPHMDDPSVETRLVTPELTRTTPVSWNPPDRAAADPNRPISMLDIRDVYASF